MLSFLWEISQISSFFGKRFFGRYPVYFELVDVLRSEPIGRILARFATFKSHTGTRAIPRWDVETTKPEGLAASGAERWMHTSIVTRAKK